MIFDTKEIVIGGTEWKTAPFRFSKMFTLGEGGEQPVPTTKQRLVSVAYNNDLALYTDDGINWNTSTMPNLRGWSQVFYGNGKFIVPCYGTNIYAYSTDGINWAEGTLPVSGNWLEGAYGNNTYVICSYISPYYICYSTDGIHWNYYNMSGWIIRKIIFDIDKFIMIVDDFNAANTTYIVTSTNGINWSKISTIRNISRSNQSIQTPMISYKGKYVFSSTKYSSQPTEQYVYCSEDIVNWNKIGTFTYNNVAPTSIIGINNEIKIFSGLSGLSQQAAGYINVDSAGTTATYVGSSVPRLNYQGGANIINGRAVVIGNASDQYIYSTDGTTWNTGTLPVSSNWYGSCVGEVII